MASLLLLILLQLLLLCLKTEAYITDIKLVSCNANHACPNYPGYYKIPADLNQGVKKATSIFLHVKQDESEDPITDLKILQFNETTPNKAKWTPLKVDLNQLDESDTGDKPTSLWLYYTKDTSISKNPVSSIIVKQGTSPTIGAEYKRIPVDLNKDVGGDHLFMYYSQDGPKGNVIYTENLENVVVILE
jgi:hypothetical protein